MNIYSPPPDDSIFSDLKEWCINNPLTDEDRFVDREFQLFQIEEARKGALLRNYTILKCEKCGKECNVGNFKRWHGDNCGKISRHTEETKKKISNTLKGVQFSEEHRKKLSESNRRRKGIKFKKRT